VTHQGPGLPVMPVMGTHRSDRVHLSKQIDLMADVRLIGFLVPALDPRNAGANAAGGEGDDISNAAVVEACAARAAEVESKGDGVGGAPQLKPCKTGAVEGEGGVKGVGLLQKHVRTDNESKGDGIGGAPQLEPRKMGA
jgi:hypothetical protein